MEGLSLTEKESIVNTIAAKLGGELYTNIFFAFWSWIVTEQLLNETGKRTHKFK